MLDTSFPSTKKRNYIEDTTILPTAEKSQHYDSEDYLDRTPDRTAFRSPARLADRLSEAKLSIQEMINEVSDKKRINEEAIGEVRMVNHEILSSFTTGAPYKQNLFGNRNRTTEQYKDDSRDYVATSQFNWQPAAPHEEELKRSTRESVVSQENIDLRGRLNEELRKNNDLMKYVAALETENASLKASRTQGPSNINVNSLIEENRQLRSQLSGSNAPYNVVEELEKLKEENSQLRKDTIHLLKGGRY